MALSKSDILNRVGGFRTKEVEIPEWGGFIRVRELSALDTIELVEKFRLGSGESLEEKSVIRIGMWLLPRIIVNEDGSRMFTDDEFVDVMSKASRDVLASINRITAETMQLSSVTEDEEEVEFSTGNGVVKATKQVSPIASAEKNSEQTIS